MYVAIKVALRSSGVDYLTAAEAGNLGQPDEWQLEFATEQRRTVLTANQPDFARIHWDWIADSRSHPGIIVIARQQVAIGTLIAKLLRLQQIRDAEGMKNSIWYLNADPSQVLE